MNPTIKQSNDMEFFTLLWIFPCVWSIMLIKYWTCYISFWNLNNIDLMLEWSYSLVSCLNFLSKINKIYIYANPHWIQNWIRMMDWDSKICIIWWCFYCCLVIKLVSLGNNFFCWISWFKIHANVVYCVCLMNNQVAFKIWMRNYVDYHFQIDPMMQILDPKCTSKSQKLIDDSLFHGIALWEEWWSHGQHGRLM